MLARAPDILVIGGGIAALCAAVAAAREGAAVRLAEIAPRPLRGGNARHARNLRIAHAGPTAFSPGAYPACEYLAELAQAACGLADPAVSQRMVQDSTGLVAWLAGHGVQFQPAGDGLLPFSRRTAFLLGGGKALVNSLYATAARLGVAIDYETHATAPLLEAGAARHVDLESPRGLERITPRCIVVCGGGAQADPDAMRPRWGNAADNFVVRGVPYADGQLLRGLLAQGVVSAGAAGECHLVAVDARSPRFDGGIVTRVLGIPEGIVVNQQARRFHDEGGDTSPTRYAVWGREVAAQPGQTAWLVLDAAAERRCPPMLYPPLRADTVAALARLAGLDEAALEATLAAYNDAVLQGGATGQTVGLTPPKSSQARTLLTPPYAAVPIRPGVTFTCLGVKVDPDARMVMQDGAIVPNLFAAGTIMAPNILGTGYLAGAAMSIAAVMGRRAGEQAARYAAS